jgi:hypothetical protein
MMAQPSAEVSVYPDLFLKSFRYRFFCPHSPPLL